MKNTIGSIVVAASVMLVAGACTDPTVAPKSSVSSVNIFSEESSYTAFLAKPPANYKGTQHVEPREGTVIIFERDSNRRMTAQ